MSSIPLSRRASLSGYVQPGKLLPWQWVSERMRTATHYRVTTHSSRYPSSRPVWGIWFDPELVFSTGSKIARNLHRDRRVQVNLERGDEVVIVEGTVAPLDDPAVGAAWRAHHLEKYRWEVPASLAGVYRVVPHRVLAWMSDGSGLDGGVVFFSTPTEWRFDGDDDEVG